MMPDLVQDVYVHEHANVLVITREGPVFDKQQR